MPQTQDLDALKAPVWALDHTTTRDENVLESRFRQKHYTQLEQQAPSAPVCSQSSSVLCPQLLNKPRNKGSTADNESREDGEQPKAGPCSSAVALKVLTLHCSPDPLRSFSPIPLKRSTKWAGAKPSQTHHSSTPGSSRPPCSLQE